MKQENDLKVLRHSAAHLLAHAVHELYPDTKLTIGPSTEEGFFYDCLPVHNFKEEDLIKIEERMHEISKRNIKLEHKEIPKALAREIYKDNPFKLELIDQIPGETAGLATQGNFYDLCRGGHVESTGQIKYFKLLGISGAYWRADRSGTALQRLSGTAFFSQKDLDEYLQRKEDLLKYDHRKLGKELDLFSFHEEGPGFVFYHPKGRAVFNALVAYMRKIQRGMGYAETLTPIILSDELWRRSGHYAHYKENMYFTTIDDKQYAIKPMNCPGSILIYKSRPHSYRELPLRFSEFGLVHRHELSGVLHGLLRVREFTQDDVHIYCTLEQLQGEILQIIKNAFDVLHKFGFEKISVKLSTRPQDSLGKDENDGLWQKATDSLKRALEIDKIDYTVDEGGGAFYGPKIDFKVEDSMGREWQLVTIQADFFQPINFDLTYVASGGQLERPVMVHSTIYGSLERFIAVILEHNKGNLPFFVAPVQIKILTITDEQKDYANKLLSILKEHDIRAEIDYSADQISSKIKSATLERVPWMFVIGKKEVENNTITLRYRDGKQEFGLTIENLLKKAKENL